MNAKAIVRDIMNRKGVGTKEMADLLGTYMQKVCDRLGTGKSANLSTDKLDEMIRALGYKAIVVPADVCLRDGWYEITDSRNHTPVHDASDIPEES